MDGEEEEIARGLEATAVYNNESVSTPINSTGGDSKQQTQLDRGPSPQSSAKASKIPNSTSNVNKARSCKGCLYYSSHFKSDSRNPLCVGITRSIPSVPQYMVGQSEMEASIEGRSLTDFRYSCIGYSIYKDRKAENASNEQQNQTELPVCAGLEILVDKGAKSTNPASAPNHVYNRDDGSGLPQRRSPKPNHSAGEEFLSRFRRNAKLVANGVAKNINKVNNQIKQSIDDALYPYRKRPK